MRIIGKSIPGVELTLSAYEARELMHVLHLHMINIDAKKQGSGSSVDEQRKFCFDLAEALASRLA
jgi:hypothetical protein